MKISVILMIMSAIVFAFSYTGMNSVTDDPNIRNFFWIYVITGGALFVASVVEFFYQMIKRKKNPVAKEKPVLPVDDTIE